MRHLRRLIGAIAVAIAAISPTVEAASPSPARLAPFPAIAGNCTTITNLTYHPDVFQGRCRSGSGWVRWGYACQTRPDGGSVRSPLFTAWVYKSATSAYSPWTYGRCPTTYPYLRFKWIDWP